jgi:hypothetical protein
VPPKTAVKGKEEFSRLEPEVPSLRASFGVSNKAIIAYEK